MTRLQHISVSSCYVYKSTNLSKKISGLAKGFVSDIATNSGFWYPITKTIYSSQSHCSDDSV